MRQRIAIGLSLLVAPLFAAPARAQCPCPADDVAVIGHRGAGSDDSAEAYPENTIESAQQAFAEGATMVEIDVQRAADGVVVLMHDDTVDRTTDGTGCVSALTADEIAALDADGASVPTLAAFLDAVEGPVNVEIKLHDGDACPSQDLDALADAVVADLEAGAGDRALLISSFDLDLLRRIRRTTPDLPIGYLSSSPADVDVAAGEGFEAIHLLSAVATARTVASAHDAGLAVNVWTVDGVEDVRAALDVGVDGVITDTADEAVAAKAAWCEDYVCPGTDAGAGPDGGDGDGGDGDGGDGDGGDGDGGCAAAEGSPGGGALGAAWGMLAALAWWRRRRAP